MIVWAIFHRGDNRWVYKKTRIEGYVNGFPLIQLELDHPAVTSPEFLFLTKGKAKKAAAERNQR